MVLLCLVVFMSIVYANILEWGVHKYVLHGVGKVRGSMWSSHFHEHHRNSIRFSGGDPDYLQWKMSPEIKGLIGLTVLHIPLCLLSIPAYLTLVAYSLAYYCTSEVTFGSIVGLAVHPVAHGSSLGSQGKELVCTFSNG